MKSQTRRLCQLTSIMFCSLCWISWPLKLRLIGCPETMVRNYHCTLHVTSEEHTSHMLVWLCMVQFRGIRFGASVLIWDDLTYLSSKFKEETSSCIQVNMVIFPVVLCGCETWSLTSRQEHRLRMFENGVLRRIFGPKRDDGTGEWRKLSNEELNDLYCLLNIIQVSKSRTTRWAEHVAHMGRGEVHTGLLWGNLRERDQLEDPGVEGRIILRWIFSNWDVGLWTGLIWLRLRTVGGLLWTQEGTFRFHKIQGISWLAEKLLVFQGLCSME